MLQKRWTLAPAAAKDHWKSHPRYSPALRQILSNRGFADLPAAEQFISSRQLDEDPFAMQDMRLAAERVKRALALGERIAVYGDYDADGVCATALMLQTLRRLGGAVIPHIPHRDEGYGLNEAALRDLARQGVRLVVTVDCGIRSLAEVAAGNAAGLDIIISDHHSVGAALPAALAVINPRRADCPGEARLSGVGVAFMLALALLQDRWRNDRANFPAGMRISDLLDLVALGTVADVMPLDVGLNRRLVAHGLDVINEGRRPGLVALAEVSRLPLGRISASDLAFRLGPRINAAGRLGSADAALALLTAETRQEARDAALSLQQLNQRRQSLTSQAQQAVDAQISDEADDCARACQQADKILRRADRSISRQLAIVRQPDAIAARAITRLSDAALRAFARRSSGEDWQLQAALLRWRKAICWQADRANRAHARVLRSRQRACRRATVKALADIKRLQSAGDAPALIFACADEAEIPLGIAGLVAGRLTEAHYRPAVIVSLGEGESRASCRSIPEFNITRALDACAHLLLRHGGHAQAAGFSIRNENLPALRRQLERQALAQLRGKTLAPSLPIDARLHPRDWSETLTQELDLLEPTGAAFPPATFVTENLRVLHKRTVGAEGSHLKLKLEGAGAKIDAIGFGLGGRAAQLPRQVDVAYHLEVNVFNGRRSLQLHLLDIRPAQNGAPSFRA